MDHKKHLDSLESAFNSAQDATQKQAALESIIKEYPLLYGYWLKYLNEYHAESREKWIEALQICPVLELYQHYFDKFPDRIEDFRMAVEQVGHYFMAAPIWDKYLAHGTDHTADILAQAIKMPLYDYAKYFSLSKDLLTDLDLTALGQQMAEEIGQRWKYESKIQRPYFHVLPLDPTDLENWNDYLDYQELSSDTRAGISLYRRCLISTALYPTFWKRYLHYAGRFVPESLDEVFNNASKYINKLPQYTEFAILYASYLEVWNRHADAERVLVDLKNAPALDDFRYRHGGAPMQLDLAEARRLWAEKKIEKHKYMNILRENGELQEFFEIDIVVNGPPGASRPMRKP